MELRQQAALAEARLAQHSGHAALPGTGDLERLLDRISAGASAEAAAGSALRMDYAELERETVKYLRRTYLR